MADFDAVIIGGGLGGLLCGNILSKEGFNVCLVEKNHKLGGSLQTFGRKGCIFNTGLNYTESLDNGQVLNQYFRYFGLMDKLNLKGSMTKALRSSILPTDNTGLPWERNSLLKPWQRNSPQKEKDCSNT